MKKTFDTIAEANQDPKGLSFNEDFNLIECGIGPKVLKSESRAGYVAVLECYRFARVGNPADSAVYRAIECKDGFKGTLRGADVAFAFISKEMTPDFNMKINKHGTH
jgi:hypothetical protein